jgi:hypothetical protein
MDARAACVIKRRVILYFKINYRFLQQFRPKKITTLSSKEKVVFFRRQEVKIAKIGENDRK